MADTDTNPAINSTANANASLGVSFDEWASAHAYLAQGKPLKDVLAVLAVTPDQWQAATAAHGKELNHDPDLQLVKHYAAVFRNPAIGKFASAQARSILGA